MRAERGAWAGPALLAVALLAGSLAAGAARAAPAPEVPAHEHLQRQLRREEVPAAYAPISVPLFLQLPEIPLAALPDLVAVDEMERQAVSLAGYVVRVVPVPTRLGRGPRQYTFHLHLRPTSEGRCLLGDSPQDLIAGVSPAFQPPRTGWDLDVLRLLCERQNRVRLSGWLLYDYSARPGVGRWRASALAIHPVTRIEVWNPQDRAWVNLP